MLFRDRIHAGRLVADRLSQYANDPDLLVCALPRGGVLVGFPVAEALSAPLDVVIVRKLGVPGQQEVAMGAIATGGVCVLSHELIEDIGISTEAVDAAIAREQRELARREALYRGAAPAPQIRGRTIILVDDGIATGATMRAAAAVVQQQQPKRLVIAVPVAPPSRLLAVQADEVVCLARPEPFFAIGEFYEDFHQVSDEEVRDLLQHAARRIARRGASTVADV
jgi:putative phosphoribosyl transferase